MSNRSFDIQESRVSLAAAGEKNTYIYPDMRTGNNQLRKRETAKGVFVLKSKWKLGHDWADGGFSVR